MAGARNGPPDQARREGLAATLRSVRSELIQAWAGRVKRELSAAPAPGVELMDHMPAFVDELIERADSPEQPLPTGSAEQHGRQRLRLGFDVAQVVREYGLLQDCILEALGRVGYPLLTTDVRLIADALNRGIADAISQ